MGGGADAAEAPAADAPKDPVSTTAAPVIAADAEAEDDGGDFALLGALFPQHNFRSYFDIAFSQNDPFRNGLLL